MHVTDQVLSIYAGTRGLFGQGARRRKSTTWEEAFLQFMREQKQGLWQKITDSAAARRPTTAGRRRTRRSPIPKRVTAKKTASEEHGQGGDLAQPQAIRTATTY